METHNSGRLQASAGTLLTAIRIKTGIPILKAVRDTRYFNACSRSPLPIPPEVLHAGTQKPRTACPGTRSWADVPRCVTEKHYLSSLDLAVSD